MKMSDIDEGFIGRYIGSVGDIEIENVGEYKVEGKGIKILEKIEGDYFKIVGMKIMKIMEEIRREK